MSRDEESTVQTGRNDKERLDSKFSSIINQKSDIKPSVCITLNSKKQRAKTVPCTDWDWLTFKLNWLRKGRTSQCPAESSTSRNSINPIIFCFYFQDIYFAKNYYFTFGFSFGTSIVHFLKFSHGAHENFFKVEFNIYTNLLKKQTKSCPGNLSFSKSPSKNYSKVLMPQIKTGLYSVSAATSIWPSQSTAFKTKWLWFIPSSLLENMYDQQLQKKKSN